MNFDKDLAVVRTGGASGLGEAVARMLAPSTRRITVLDLIGDSASPLNFYR